MGVLHLVNLSPAFRNFIMIKGLCCFFRFVVSAISMAISKYGLIGIEAAMLMDKRWAPANTMQLMAHSDKVSHTLDESSDVFNPL
jgi:hypothetical protein